jgi:uncharacterized protein (DUF1501 family)
LPLHAKIADKFTIVNGVQTTDRHDPKLAAAAQHGFGAWVEVLGLPDSAGEPGRIEYKHVKQVELPYGNWDTHGRVLGRQLSIFDELREKLPAYDRLIHDLVTDVYQRGLEKDVLIIAHGEFGRTPWMNEHGGRNHWAPSGSVLFAGGGLKMGQVIGDTGPIGERDRSRTHPYRAGNIMAMMYRHLYPGLALPATAEPIAELV